MTTRRAVAAAGAVARVAAIALAGSTSAETPSLRPGLYETTLRVTIAGESAPPETDRQCFTKDDLEGLDRWLATRLGDGCSATDRKAVDGKLLFTVRCPDDGGLVTTRGELTTGKDSFSAVVRMSEDAGSGVVQSVFASTGTRVGDCAK